MYDRNTVELIYEINDDKVSVIVLTAYGYYREK